MAEHPRRCPCFECFCEKQLRRVNRITKDSWRDEERRLRRRTALQAIHDNMIIRPISSACLPNLDYYDNRVMPYQRKRKAR